MFRIQTDIPFIFLAFILFLCPLVTSETHIYHHGIHYLRALSPHNTLLDASYGFAPFDTPYFFNASNVQDVVFSNGYMFFLADQNIAIPEINLIDTDVLAISGLQIDNSEYHFTYLTRSSFCFGTLNMGLNTQFEPTCSYNSTFQNALKLDVYNVGSAYLLLDNEELYTLTYSDTELVNDLYKNNVQMLSYPIIMTNDNKDIYHLGHGEYINGLGPDIVPIYINSIKENNTFIVQYSDGSFWGYGFTESFRHIQGTCPNVFDTPCSINAASITPGFDYYRDTLIYFDEQKRVMMLGKHGSMNPIEGDITDSHSLRVFTVPDGLFFAFRLGVDDIHYHGSFSTGPYVYTMQYRNDKFSTIKSYDKSIKKSLALMEDFYIHNEEGDIIRITKDTEETIASNVSNVSLYPKGPSIHIYYIDQDGKLCNENGEIPFEVPPVDPKKVVHSSTLGVLTEGRYTMYDKFSSYRISTYVNADDAFLFDDSGALILYNNEIYCFGKKCCIMDVNVEESKVLDIMTPEDIIDNHRYPIRKGDIGTATIQSVVASSEFLFVLTTDGNVYSCNFNIPTKKKESNHEEEHKTESRQNDIHILNRLDDDLLNNVDICDLFIAPVSYTLYMTVCNSSDVYIHGPPPNSFYTMIENEGVMINELYNQVHKFEESPKHKRLIDVSGIYLDNYLVYEDIPCDASTCIIDDLNGNNDTIILPNSTMVIISNPSHINNSTIIVNNGTTIIIEGTLEVSNSTIVYKIPTKEVLDGIKDGDRIVIIDASNGDINGEFENIILDYEESLDECKSVEAELDQSNNQVSVIFHVQDLCVGFPIWAIILIVIGCILIIVVIIILVLKKSHLKVFKSKSKRMSTVESQNVTHKNETYEPSGTSKSNPSYQSKHV